LRHTGRAARDKNPRHFRPAAAAGRETTISAAHAEVVGLFITFPCASRSRGAQNLVCRKCSTSACVMIRRLAGGWGMIPKKPWLGPVRGGEPAFGKIMGKQKY